MALPRALEETVGKSAQAVNSYRQAIDRQPTNKEAHFRLGKVLERLGKTVEAGHHLARSTELADRFKAVRREHQQVRRTGLPKDPRVYEKLGESCLGIRLIPEARAWFEESLQLDPTGAQVRLKLIELSSRSDSTPVFLPRPTLLPGRKLGQVGATSSVSTDQQSKVVPGRPPTSSTIVLEDQAGSAGIEYRYTSGASDRYSLADTTGGEWG